MTEDNRDLAAERDKLQAECARLRAERVTGVPAELLGNAFDEESAMALAEQCLAWRAADLATPPTSAVSPHNGAVHVGQVPRSQLPLMSPDQIIQAYSEGRLKDIGGLNVDGQA